MAAYSEIKHNGSRQAGKQAVFSEKCICRSQVMCILLDMKHMGDNMNSNPAPPHQMFAMSVLQQDSSLKWNRDFRFWAEVFVVKNGMH